MTERNEAASERLALSTVKSEVLTHDLGMGDRELGLQPVPLAYPQQDIIVEVPLINGELPATLHSSTENDTSNMLQSEGTCGVTAARRNQLCEGPEAIHCKEESSLHCITPKEEQLRKRREQNKCRMRALRASESEVAQRLRERNKFRMRTLRASDSQVAQSLRERNKYRMREIRSSGSHFTCRTVEDRHAESE